MSRFVNPGAGDLSHRVAIETIAQTPSGGDTGTGLAQTYSTIADAWGRLDGLAGGRYVAGRQIEEVATHRLTIRYQAAALPATHVSESVTGGTRRFAVRGIVDPDGKRRWLQLDLEEERPS
jgi:head-tail adaptor